MNKKKIISTPITKWTLEEIKAIAEQMRKSDPVLVQMREEKVVKTDKQKPQ